MFNRSGENVVDGINFFLSDLTGSLVEIDSGGLEDSVGKSSADTFNALQSEHCLDVTFDVGVLDSKNVSILFVINDIKRCLKKVRI